MFVIMGAEYKWLVNDFGPQHGVVADRCGRCVFDRSPTHDDVHRIRLRGTLSGDRADPQVGIVKPDDVGGGDIRSADPLARRVPWQPRRSATARDACGDSGTAVSAGSITNPAGEALSADVVPDRALPQLFATRNVHIHATLGAAVRERIHAFNLLHRQQAAQCERNRCIARRTAYHASLAGNRPDSASCVDAGRRPGS
jgi:hypothetical protein